MTSTILTIRKALKQIREDLAADSVSYLSGPRYYETDKGTLLVRNADGADKFSSLLGVFVAELLIRGRTITTYKI